MREEPIIEQVTHTASGDTTPFLSDLGQKVPNSNGSTSLSPLVVLFKLCPCPAKAGYWKSAVKTLPLKLGGD